ncbi:hypothetical protein N9562_00405 [Flavobacteriaceae bacterium]|nr:hypothetical protein [Flavobacteriaceae bacterium]
MGKKRIKKRPMKRLKPKSDRTSKGTFEVGNQVSRGAGRPVGAKNKTTYKTKEILADILENNIENVQDDIDSLEPKDRLNFLMNLASYVVPKLKSVEVQADVSHHNMLGLSGEEIIELEAEITTINERDDSGIDNGWKKGFEGKDIKELDE